MAGCPYCKVCGVPRIVDHAQRRQEIVHAMWAVIYRRGIPGVSFQAVAVEAGVSIGRIQHYFPSKRELVLAGARAIVDASTQAWQEVDQVHAHTALSALVRQPVPRTESFRMGSAVWYAYLAASIADPEIGSLVRDALRGAFDAATWLTADLAKTCPGDTGGPAVGADGARTQAIRLIGLSNGLAQAVLVGALEVDEALAVLDMELEQHHRR